MRRRGAWAEAAGGWDSDWPMRLSSFIGAGILVAVAIWRYFPARSLVAAATVCFAEIPAAFISSSGLPDVGRSFTAR